MNFSDLTRPEDFAKLATPLPKANPDHLNKSGLQGAHVIGKNEWNARLLEILDELKSDRAPEFGPNSLFNGVLLPESKQGGTSIGAGNHNGLQLRAFDSVFFDNVNNDSRNYFNRFALEMEAALGVAELNSPEEVETTKSQYRVKLMNFIDTIKIQFLHQDILNKISAEQDLGPLKTLAFNNADARSGTSALGGGTVESYLNSVRESGHFNYANIEDSKLYKLIAGLRGAEEVSIDNLIVERIPETSRIIFPDGKVMMPLEVRADVIERQALVDKYSTTTGTGEAKVDYEKVLAATKTADFEVSRARTLEGLQRMGGDLDKKPFSFNAFKEAYDKIDLGKSAAWTKVQIERFGGIEAISNGNPEFETARRTVQDFYDAVKLDSEGKSTLPGLDAKAAVKVGSVATALAFGLLKAHTAYVKYDGLTPEFWDWVKGEAAAVAVSLPFVAGGLFLLGSNPLGMAVLIGGAGALTYLEVRGIVEDIIANREKYADGSLAVSAAETVHGWMTAFEAQIKPIFDVALRMYNDLSTAASSKLAALEQLLVPEFQFVAGQSVAVVYKEGQWLVGDDGALLIGSAGNDVLIHRGYGEVHGLDGNDVLIGWSADYKRQGDLLDASEPEPEEGEDDTRARAESDLRLTLNGGDGDDLVIALGGTGAITIGGAGRDFIFNTSAYGQLFGDSVDGQGNSDGAASGEGKADSDVFWYWPGTFIMDAKPNDLLQFFGLPLLGGSNSVAGIYAGDGSLAMDWFFPFVFYGYSQGGQLLIYNALMANIGPENMKGIMVVEDYTFGKWKDAEWGRPGAGDLGMTFRIMGDVPGAVEISLWRAVWGHLFTKIDVLWNLTKAIRWQPVDDPLVLDLDGDGIETLSKLQSGVYYDLDGDYFAERTGWLSGDDGFLVLDRNGNGRIDDISEMFGGPGASGFAQLAAFDTNGDGLVTAADARFGELRVWRDLDGDGVTDNGELFTLDALGIVSLGVAGAPLDIETPQGNRLLARGEFTRADGTTGAMYDMAFDTDPTDTIFRGERGHSRRVRGRARGGSPWRKTCLMKREQSACKLRINAF